MRRIALLATVFVLSVLTLPATGPRGKQPRRVPKPLLAPKPSVPLIERVSDWRTPSIGKQMSSIPMVAAPLSSVPTAAAPWDSFTLGEYTFDDSVGGPDSQGWITIDSSAPGDTFFHVDDFAGLSGGYSPLEGNQSMWCGVRPDSLLLCHYTDLPGYGNGWFQYFESVPFVSSGDVTVSFLMRYDSESGYDFTFVEFWHTSFGWGVAAAFDGTGDSLVTITIDADDLAGSARIRFRFQSDGAYSDEDGLFISDGAVIIDSLTVADTLGVLDFQDFEGEAPGALTTLDGDWVAKSGAGTPFTNYSSLFDGTTVLQEDSVVTNSTNVWGFFNGSPDFYDCGGFPAQPIIPYTLNPGSTDPADYLSNEIWTPLLKLDEDKDGQPVPPTGSVTVDFDVYADLPLDNLVFFFVHVRSMVDGCFGEWRYDFAFYDADKQWKRVSYELFPYIDAGATHIQVALGVVDLCYLLCGSWGTGGCHSHGPLFDNVKIAARVPGKFTVTNTNDSGAGSFRDVLLAADISPARNRVCFNIPGPGPHTILPLTPLPGITWPIAIDGSTQPGYSGTPLVAICGDSAGTSAGLLLDGGQSLVRGLSIYGFTGSGILSRGDGDTICANYLGLTPSQTAAPNGQYGVRIESNSDKMVIGSTQPGDGNTIAYNGIHGVWFRGSSTGWRNAIRGNSIHSNTGMGIDFYPAGPTPNDFQDLDGGPNSKQNHPVLDRAYATIDYVAGSFHGTPNSTLDVDFYANAACDSNGYGEGERYLGSIQVTTASDGNVDFSTTLFSPMFVGEEVTATATDAIGNTSEFSPCVTVGPDATGIPDGPSIPDRLALFQNAPNPFNPTTHIRYDVPVGGAMVNIVVYDVAGRYVQTLVDGFQQAGRKRATWNGLNARGQATATGVYFVRMQSGSFVQTKKMVLLK